MKSTLPFTLASISGISTKTLIDSGCEQSVVSKDIVNRLGLSIIRHMRTIKMLNGNTTQCYGEVNVAVNVENCESMLLRCLVAPELVCDCGLILGIDGICKLGGVTINADGGAIFSCSSNFVVAAGQKEVNKQPLPIIDDSDFTASFDGAKWTVAWKWKDHEPVLKNQCAEYAINADCKEQYDSEIEQWISDGWLALHNESVHGKVSGVIPLMAVFQPKLGK